MPDVFECGLIGMGPAGIGLAMSLRGTSTIKNMICFERGSFNIDPFGSKMNYLKIMYAGS